MTDYNPRAESIIPKKDAQNYDAVLRRLNERAQVFAEGGFVKSAFAEGGLVSPKHNHLTRVVLEEKGKCEACDNIRSKWAES